MKFFEISIDNDLNLMKENQSLPYLTSSIIKSLENEFNNNTPKMVVVQGDTISAFSGAMASFLMRIPIAHVEAGLRTNNLFEPFPEEANRRLISQISDLHFSPTKNAYENLEKLGIKKDLYITGNTVIDALLIASKKIENFNYFDFDLASKKVILATVHRRENWGANIRNISLGIKRILDQFPDTLLLMPMHPNLKVRKSIKDILGSHKQAILVEPFTYDKLVYSIKNCYLVITDSGGIQEEAPALGKPVLVTRNFTERVEAIDAGTSILVGTDPKDIFNAAKELLLNKSKYLSMSKSINPFGDGKSSEKIFKIICKKLNIKY